MTETSLSDVSTGDPIPTQVGAETNEENPAIKRLSGEWPTFWADKPERWIATPMPGTKAYNAIKAAIELVLAGGDLTPDQSQELFTLPTADETGEIILVSVADAVDAFIYGNKPEVG